MGLDYADRRLNFLLSRIVGDVTFTREHFEAPPGDHSAEALRELEEFWQRNTATIAMEPGSDAAVRLGRRYGGSTPDDGLLVVHYSDLALLADELAGYGPEVTVLEPAALAQAVLSRLEATEWAHRDGERRGTAQDARGSAA
jgi:proteasome accessory factor B